MVAWAETILSRVLGLVEYRFSDGAELDAYRGSVDGGVVDTAEATAQACAAHGVFLPFGDAQFGAVVARDGQGIPVGAAPRGAALILFDGRTGMVAGRGAVVESAGPNLGLIIDPGPGRYVSAWLLPGIKYLGWP